MNENIDLREILKDCPKGTKLYSPMFGDVFLSAIKTNEIQITIQDDNKVKSTTSVKINGCLNSDFSDGECLLFPSKDQRDWSKFKIVTVCNSLKVGDYVRHHAYDICKVTEIDEHSHRCSVQGLKHDGTIIVKQDDLVKIDKYPIENFKPFQKVLVRDVKFSPEWKANFFSHLREDEEYKFQTMSTFYPECVPYNNDTKKLLGTEEEAPEFYINWEEE